MVQVVTQPHTAHAGGRNREPTFLRFVGDADLAERRLLNGERNDGVLSSGGSFRSNSFRSASSRTDRCRLSGLLVVRSASAYNICRIAATPNDARAAT